MSQKDYINKLILAPMVRVGTLPLRLLSIKYGADIVYSPELISKRLMKTKRLVNNVLGTVDFVDDSQNGGIVLRTTAFEKPKLIVQIGASDPVTALAAAKVVQHDVFGIDLNCGCPKPFSTHDGSGAALLETPDLLISILESLVSGLSLPITCKIRLLPETSEDSSLVRTKALLRRIEGTGVKAVAIHCRFPHEKPREKGHWDVFEELANSVSIPVIANGDLYSREDLDVFRSDEGSLCRSFMFARGAHWNPSVFRKEGMLDIRIVMEEYCRIAVRYDILYNNIKYTLLQMKYPEPERVAFHKLLIQCKSTKEIWFTLCLTRSLLLGGMSDFYESETKDIQKRRAESDVNDLDCLHPKKRIRNY